LTQYCIINKYYKCCYMYIKIIFTKTSILSRKCLRLTRNCRTWNRSNYQQVCHKEVRQNHKNFLNIGQWLIIYKRICNKSMFCWNYCFKFWAVACKQFSGSFTVAGSGAVKRFVITTSVNSVSTANIKFEAAKRLGNMTE